MTVLKRSEPAILSTRDLSAGRKLLESHHHVEGFYGLVKYLVRLRHEGAIEDEVFEELVKRVSALFIEAELTERIDKIIENKLSPEILLDIFQ